MLKTGLRPRDIMTKAAIQNALTIVMALGGSTNAVLHFLAIGRALGVEVTLDDFQRISDQTPFIADLKPSGKYVMEDLHNVRLPVRPLAWTHHTLHHARLSHQQRNEKEQQELVPQVQYRTDAAMTY